MRISGKIIACILLSAMLGTIAVGYAEIADNLTLTGDTAYEGKPYEGVYITEVTPVESSNATCVVCDYILPTNHVSSVHTAGAGGSVTYKITVHNNTDVTYWYIGQDLIPEYESNSLVGGGITVVTNDKQDESGGTFNSEDWIPPQTTRDFYATYTYGASAQGFAVTTMINFWFGIRMDAVHDEFLAVLNDDVSALGYQYLSGIFDDAYEEDGSLTLDSVNDPEVFAALFGDLIVNIDGSEKQATVVVRRENVDGKATGDSYDGGGPSGCEYTVYITVDDPKASGSVKVYAISYTHGSANTSGEWYQLGQLYEGTASTSSDGTFDISTWQASPNIYTLANGITYKVGQPNGDQYDIMKKLEDLMSTHDQDIFNDINNSKILKTVYDILVAHSTSHDPAVVGLRDAFNNASPYYNVYNGGQQFDIKRDYTRAEIIPVIESIQHALDYYYQTFGD